MNTCVPRLTNSPVCDFDGVGRSPDIRNSSHPAEVVLRLVSSALQAVVTRVTVHHGYGAAEPVSGVTLQDFEL